MPRGGARPGAGRPKGAKNKITRHLKELCREYTEDVVYELYRLTMRARSESARVMAAKELLNRGWGKAPQALRITGADDGPLEMISRNMTAREAADLYQRMVNRASEDED